MTDLKFVVDTTDLDKAITKSNKIEREIRKLVQAEKAGAISTEQYSKRVGQLASQLQSATGGNIRARKSVYDYSVATREAAKQVDTFDKEVKQSEATVRRYNRSLRSAGGYVNQFGENVSFSGKRVNRFGANMQQVGYQVGDFAVQVQGGTSWLVALGQQGAQLAGIFGPAGALAGAALAIGTALVIPFTRGSEEIDKLVDRIKDLKGEIKELSGDFVPPEFDANLKKLEDLDLEILALRAEKADQETLAEAFRGNAQAAGLYLQYSSEALALEARINEKLEERESISESINEYSNLSVDRAKLLFEREQESIAAQNTLLKIKQEYGEDSYQYRVAENEQILKAFEIEQRRNIQNKKLVDQLVEQKRQALELQLVLESITRLNFDNLNLSFPSFGPNETLQTRLKTGMHLQLGNGQSEEVTLNKPTKRRSGGGGSKGETQEEYLAKLQREIDFKKDSIGVFGEERKIMEEVARLKEQVIKKDYDISEKKLEQIVREEAELDRQLKNQQDMYDTFHSNISNAMMDLVTGAASVEDAFKQMLFNIISEIYKQRVVEPVANIGADLLGKVFGFSQGGAFVGGSPVKAFASGGVVNSPTMFPMRGNQTGLMGEAGAEAIMPLKRTANGDLGVQVAGGQMQKSEVVISLSPELIAQVLSQAEGNSIRVVQQAAGGIVKASVNAVTNERRKGGTMKAAFG